MDWKLAKNYTIIFLIILNIILFVANFFNDNKYKISQSQKNAIMSYLEKNNINLYTDLPVKHYPMQQIRVIKQSYDYFVLQDIFFENKENIKRTEEFSNTIFSNENETLTIYPDSIFYESLPNNEEAYYSKDDVLEFCDKYIEEIKKHYSSFTLDRIVENDEYFLVEFNQKINNYTIFNNYIKFKIYKNGAKEIYFYYLEVDNFFSSKLDICSIDEALYVFSKEMKEVFGDEDISIRQIDLGYYSQDISSESVITLIPHYRFFITNTKEAFYVNAYTNTFVD